MTVLKALIKAPKNPMCKYLCIIFLGVCTLIFTSCEQQITSREYEEIVIAPVTDPHDFMRSSPFAGEQHLNSPLSWEVPQGWSEEKGSGMRLVTFRDPNSSMECSIISLGGQAGGFRSNVTRWMNQINVSIPAGDQLSAFLSRQQKLKSKGGFVVTIIDLSELSQGEHAPSMIAAITELENKTIFVKMTGSRGDVITNRVQFTSLCRSLAL